MFFLYQAVLRELSNISPKTNSPLREGINNATPSYFDRTSPSNINLISRYIEFYTIALNDSTEHVTPRL